MTPRVSLEYDEKIICESKSEKSPLALFITILFISVSIFMIALPFLPFGGIGLAFLLIIGLIFFAPSFYCLIYYLKNLKFGETIQLIITSKKVMIYNKKLHDYNNIEFKDILNWQIKTPGSLSSNNRGIYGKFIFYTTFNTFVVNSISNYAEMYRALNKIKPNNQYSNIRKDNYPSDIKTYFDSILRNEFSEYSIQENVSTKTINSSSAGMGYRPYSYVLYKGGRAAAAIMLTQQHNDKNKAFLGAKDVCLKAGIPFINFYTHLPNEYEYVVNRIKSFI